MSANGKYTQYMTQKEKGPMSPFERKVEDFIEYLSDVGVVANKNDAFIIKRRYKLSAKDIKGNYETNFKLILELGDIVRSLLQL